MDADQTEVFLQRGNVHFVYIVEDSPSLFVFDSYLFGITTTVVVIVVVVVVVVVIAAVIAVGREV